MPRQVRCAALVSWRGGVLWLLIVLICTFCVCVCACLRVPELLSVRVRRDLALDAARSANALTTHAYTHACAWVCLHFCSCASPFRTKPHRLCVRVWVCVAVCVRVFVLAPHAVPSPFPLPPPSCFFFSVATRWWSLAFPFPTLPATLFTCECLCVCVCVCLYHLTPHTHIHTLSLPRGTGARVGPASVPRLWPAHGEGASHALKPPTKLRAGAVLAVAISRVDALSTPPSPPPPPSTSFALCQGSRRLCAVTFRFAFFSFVHSLRVSASCPYSCARPGAGVYVRAVGVVCACACGP